ncbi:MAG: hypothetical protein ACE145_20170 [Terriglobia bacterium]
MRFFANVAALLLIPAWIVHAQQPQGQPAPDASAPETVNVTSPGKAPAPAPASAENVATAARIKELSQKLYLAEFRINDLLTEVRPERWKVSDEARNSFNQTLATLRDQLTAVDGWRVQLESRPNSIYLGFMTYAAINAALPRLDAVARSITQHVNASLGAQFSQAGNQLFDLQQALQPHLATLLQNQDEVMFANENNLAACQSQLSLAMRGKTAPAKLMKNVLPEFKGRRVKRSAETPGQKPAPATTVPPTAPSPKKP